MLATELSPVHQLVCPWWKSRATRLPRIKIPNLREMLWEAALSEMRLLAAQGTIYDPWRDSRVAWAAEFLNLGEGYQYSIDPDTRARASLFFDPPIQLCGKELAAGN